MDTLAAPQSFLVQNEKNSSFGGGSEQRGDLANSLNVIKRRKNIILGCMAIITLIGVVIVFGLIPRYTAESSVILDGRKTQIVDTQAVLSGLPADTAVVHSEVEVLKSSDIAQKVAEKMNLIAQPEFNPRLSGVQGIRIVVVPFRWLAGEIAQLFGAQPTSSAALAQSDLDEATRILQSQTDVYNDGRSYVLKIRVESQSPKLATDLANAYVDVYLNSQLEAKFDAVQRANTWLNDHLADLRAKAETTDRAVQQFGSAHNLTPSHGDSVNSQQMSELNTQLVLASADLAEKDANLKQVQTSLQTRGVSAAAQVLSSPLIQALREQESTLMTHEADLATRYKPEHPAMINIKAQERDLNRKIEDETARIVHSMEGDVVSGQAKVDTLRASITDLQSGPQNEAQVQFHELQREADANRALYENFLNRYKQTSEQEDIQEADARIVSRAVLPITPSFPRKIPFIGGIFIASLITGVFAAFGMERLDNGFRTGEQFERIAEVPVLGLEPDIAADGPPHDIVVKRPVSAYSEAIRSIRTSLRYSHVDKPPKIVMVTSSLPDEGKTVFALSLARSVAKSGGRSLLIDCDLRRPSMARILNIDATPGLLAVFDGTKDLSKVIKVDVASGMHFIAVASGTPNPQDLLGSNQMKSFLESLREQYDLVVLDTPPILAVSDGIVLSHLVDATIFLVS
jgi:capsular exopolysaccharide synthesis family protein